MSGSHNFRGDKPAQDSLRNSEGHYRAVAEAATDAIITINSQSAILLVNPAAEKIFGYSSEEMIGRQLTMLMPKYQRHRHREGMARYLETGQRHLEWGAVQLPGLHKDGHEIALEISFLEFIKDGQRFFTGIVRKVPEPKQPPADLRSTTEMLSAIINQTTVGISLVDMQGHFTFANECYCKIVGRTREDLLKMSMAVITHSDDLKENLAMFERAITGGGSFEITKRYVRPDGTSVPVHDSLSVLHDAAGQPFGVMAVTLDLTKNVA